MDSIWTMINDEMGKYMEKVIKKYNMNCVKLNKLSSILYNDYCYLIINIDRFGVDFIYVFEEEGEILGYECSNYLCMRFDDVDRQNLLQETKAGDAVKNELIVIANGWVNKCEDVLTGEKDWIQKYEKSPFYSKTKLPIDVERIIKIILSSRNNKK